MLNSKMWGLRIALSISVLCAASLVADPATDLAKLQADAKDKVVEVECLRTRHEVYGAQRVLSDAIGAYIEQPTVIINNKPNRLYLTKDARFPNSYVSKSEARERLVTYRDRARFELAGSKGTNRTISVRNESGKPTSRQVSQTSDGSPYVVDYQATIDADASPLNAYLKGLEIAVDPSRSKAQVSMDDEKRISKVLVPGGAGYLYEAYKVAGDLQLPSKVTVTRSNPTAPPGTPDVIVTEYGDFTYSTRDYADWMAGIFQIAKDDQALVIEPLKWTEPQAAP